MQNGLYTRTLVKPNRYHMRPTRDLYWEIDKTAIWRHKSRLLSRTLVSLVYSTASPTISNSTSQNSASHKRTTLLHHSSISYNTVSHNTISHIHHKRTTLLHCSISHNPTHHKRTTLLQVFRKQITLNRKTLRCSVPHHPTIKPPIVYRQIRYRRRQTLVGWVRSRLPFRGGKIPVFFSHQRCMVELDQEP
jgi:hypothetical protein